MGELSGFQLAWIVAIGSKILLLVALDAVSGRMVRLRQILELVSGIPDVKVVVAAMQWMTCLMTVEVSVTTSYRIVTASIQLNVVSLRRLRCLDVRYRVASLVMISSASSTVMRPWLCSMLARN